MVSSTRKPGKAKRSVEETVLDVANLVWVTVGKTEHQAWLLEELDNGSTRGDILILWESTRGKERVPISSVQRDIATRRRSASRPVTYDEKSPTKETRSTRNSRSAALSLASPLARSRRGRKPSGKNNRPRAGEGGTRPQDSTAAVGPPKEVSTEEEEEAETWEKVGVSLDKNLKETAEVSQEAKIAGNLKRRSVDKKIRAVATRRKETEINHTLKGHAGEKPIGEARGEGETSEEEWRDEEEYVKPQDQKVGVTTTTVPRRKRKRERRTKGLESNGFVGVAASQSFGEYDSLEETSEEEWEDEEEYEVPVRRRRSEAKEEPIATRLPPRDSKLRLGSLEEKESWEGSSEEEAWHEEDEQELESDHLDESPVRPKSQKVKPRSSTQQVDKPGKNYLVAQLPGTDTTILVKIRYGSEVLFEDDHAQDSEVETERREEDLMTATEPKGCNDLKGPVTSDLSLKECAAKDLKGTSEPLRALRLVEGSSLQKPKASYNFEKKVPSNLGIKGVSVAEPKEGRVAKKEIETSRIPANKGSVPESKGHNSTSSEVFPARIPKKACFAAKPKEISEAKKEVRTSCLFKKSISAPKPNEYGASAAKGEAVAARFCAKDVDTSALSESSASRKVVPTTNLPEELDVPVSGGTDAISKGVITEYLPTRGSCALEPTGSISTKTKIVTTRLPTKESSFSLSGSSSATQKEVMTAGVPVKEDFGEGKESQLAKTIRLEVGQGGVYEYQVEQEYVVLNVSNQEPAASMNFCADTWQGSAIPQTENDHHKADDYGDKKEKSWPVSLTPLDSSSNGPPEEHEVMLTETQQRVFDELRTGMVHNNYIEGSVAAIIGKKLNHEKSPPKNEKLPLPAEDRPRNCEAMAKDIDHTDGESSDDDSCSSESEGSDEYETSEDESNSDSSVPTLKTDQPRAIQNWKSFNDSYGRIGLSIEALSLVKQRLDADVAKSLLALQEESSSGGNLHLLASVLESPGDVVGE